MVRTAGRPGIEKGLKHDMASLHGTDPDAGLSAALRFACVVVLTTVIVGCAGDGPVLTSPVPLPAMGLKEGGPTANARYMLVPGDVIEVKFYYHAQLNERTPVRPDGRIALQLIDDIHAAGLTPMELDTALTRAYARHIKEPELSVLVREFAPRHVYVGGEVNTPGLIKAQESLTALRAIIQSGGFKETGNIESVVVLRYNGTTTPEFMTLNFKGDLKTGAQSGDIWLQPFDVVFVPKTRIASANQFVSEYIDKMIPIQRNMGVFWNLFPANTGNVLGR